jgi:hypothetical protein
MNIALFQARTQKHNLAPLHVLLFIQTLNVVLVSVNRLGSWTLSYVAPNEFLRWVDFINMIPLPLISVVSFYLLKKNLEGAGGAATTKAIGWILSLVFVVGVYLLGASYGDHEVTNYLHVRFCANDTSSDLCRIVIYNDDEFSHYLFFIGFVVVNLVMLWTQVVYPSRDKLNALDKALIVFNGLFIGLGIFANLAFEVIGLDLYVVALLALIAVALLIRRGAQPMFIYYTTAYGFGLLGTALYKMFIV